MLESYQGDFLASSGQFALVSELLLLPSGPHQACLAQERDFRLSCHYHAVEACLRGNYYTFSNLFERIDLALVIEVGSMLAWPTSI